MSLICRKLFVRSLYVDRARVCGYMKPTKTEDHLKFCGSHRYLKACNLALLFSVAIGVLYCCELWCLSFFVSLSIQVAGREGCVAFATLPAPLPPVMHWHSIDCQKLLHLEMAFTVLLPWRQRNREALWKVNHLTLVGAFAHHLSRLHMGCLGNTASTADSSVYYPCYGMQMVWKRTIMHILVVVYYRFIMQVCVSPTQVQHS